MRKLTNIRPFKMRFIPWGWKNTETKDGVFAIDPPGEIKMPKEFNSYFDWRRWELQGDPWDDRCTMDHKSVFTTAARFLGYDKLLAEQPDLSPITDVYLEWNKTLLEKWEGRIKWFIIGDDIAAKDRLMMSPKTLREWVFPQIRRLVELGIDYGCRIIYHTDGAVKEALEDIYQLRVDVLWTHGDIGDMTSYKGMKIWNTAPEMQPREYTVLDGKFRMYYPDGLTQDFEQEEFLKLLHVLSRRKGRYAQVLFEENT